MRRSGPPNELDVLAPVRLRFINHACLAIEDDTGILLLDPWLEGLAFNNSWSLLDQTTSNSALLESLVEARKAVTVWYSHEHSDHFSISFLRSLAQVLPSSTVCFQATLDRRVARFIEGTGLRAVELNGERFPVTEMIDLWCWPHEEGDSYCLIRAGGSWLLNMNDCVVKTRKQAALVRDKVSVIAPSIDLAFLQFGYADWAGNPSETELRTAVANEKLARIALQIEVFQPDLVVPFASFISFCAPENAYLNAEQNSPATVRRASVLESHQSRIAFMAPAQEVVLDSSACASLLKKSNGAELHWQAAFDEPPLVLTAGEEIPLDRLVSDWNCFRKRAFRAFAFLPQLLEAVRLITPIRVHLSDRGRVLRLSYLRGARAETDEGKWDISMSSGVLGYTLGNDFGFSTTHVGGRFRVAPESSIEVVLRFFSVQAYLRDGWGLRHPVRSARRLLALLARRA